MFGTTKDPVRDLVCLHDLLDFANHILHLLVAVAFPLPHKLLDLLVFFREQILEGQILQFVFDLGNTEPVRDRRVHRQCFRGDFLLFFGLHVFQRAHVVQPVRQLDQDDTHVFGQRNKQLAVVARQVFLLVFELDRLDFRDRVHKHGDFLAKRFDDRVVIHAFTVLDCVVQQPGRDGFRSRVKKRQRVGDLDDMDLVGRAAFPELPGMMLVRERVRPSNQIEIFRSFDICLHVLHAFFKCHFVFYTQRQSPFLSSPRFVFFILPRNGLERGRECP